MERLFSWRKSLYKESEGMDKSSARSRIWRQLGVLLDGVFRRMPVTESEIRDSNQIARISN